MTVANVIKHLVTPRQFQLGSHRGRFPARYHSLLLRGHRSGPRGARKTGLRHMPLAIKIHTVPQELTSKSEEDRFVSCAIKRTRINLDGLAA